MAPITLEQVTRFDDLVTYFMQKSDEAKNRVARYPGERTANLRESSTWLEAASILQRVEFK